MEKFILLIAMAVLVSFTHAQQQEGKITYERTAKLQIQIANEDPEIQNLIPKERKDRYECLFGGNKSIYRSAEEDPQSGEMQVSGGGAEIRMIIPGLNDIIFYDFNTKTKVEQRELFTKNFVIQDSIRPMNWKVGNETKMILGMNCRKAIGTRTQQSFRMTLENGKTERKEVIDTLNVVAWFTNEIAGFNGPDQYQGQLPGTVLEVDVNNGTTTFVAVELSKKVDLKEIKEPKGKKITPAEFALERDKMMKEMESNGGGTFNFRSR